jgi:acetate kinase
MGNSDRREPDDSATHTGRSRHHEAAMSFHTAGIGEHAPEIRRRVCDKSAWLGAILDADANQRGDACISAPESRLSVWVIPTDEERTIARQTIDALGAKNATSSFNSAMVHP